MNPEKGNNILDESSDSGDDPSSRQYNPVRHFVSALFPQKYKHKFMLMLTSYMDETGHSRDEKSKFNGMAGLLCKVEEWERFEARWAKMLKRFGIPYIHMTEGFTMFRGWSKTRLDALSSAAWGAIEKIRPLPLGSILSMESFRSVEEKFRHYFDDPYFVAMQDVMKGVLGSVVLYPDQEVKVAMVFSDQVEFRYNAQQLFEAVKGIIPPHIRDKIDPPDFRDMREWGALQAADMIAYEIYKEHDRVYYNRPRERREGYKRILGIYERQGIQPLAIQYHDAESLNNIIRVADRSTRLEEYWERKRSRKGT